MAQRRAADMIPEGGDERGERWDAQARDVLSILMHAATLDDRPMHDVLSWISDPGAEASDAVHRALEASPERQTLQHSAAQFFGTNPATKTSITATMRPALRWLMDSRAAALGDAAPEDQVDFGDLILSNATVYLLGENNGMVAPLVAALTAEIAYQARMIAARMPGGRLDPPLTVALDEAAIICRVPLNQWTADMGGRGITIHISVQSRAQLIDKWGEAGARTILGNVGTLLVFGGTVDDADLRAWSTLAGEREVAVEIRDSDGKLTSTTTRKEPVLSPAQITNLPEGMVFVKRKGMPPAIGRAAAGWRRRDIVRAGKRTPFRPAPETTYSAPTETTTEGDQ